ncbi:hypothetical protein MKW92_004185, partial [Papaver armeniacum]
MLYSSHTVATLPSSYVHSSYENPFETLSFPPTSLPPPLPHEPTSNVLASTGEDSEVEGVLLPPPRKRFEQDIVRRIEVLCQLIAKNGLAFKFYFQWMRSKCCMDLQLGEQTEKTISLPAPLEIEAASQSAQDSDMEMEGLKEPGSKSNEVSFVNVKEQSPGHPHLISLTSWNTTSGLLPASEASITAADGIEQQKSVHGRPSAKDDSSAEGGL